jgi:L-asparaginase II
MNAMSTVNWRRSTGVPLDRRPAPKIIRAIDGCGVVVFGLPLEAMARAYARFASPHPDGDEVPSRITRAITSRPFRVRRLRSIRLARHRGNERSRHLKVGAGGRT